MFAKRRAPPVPERGEVADGRVGGRRVLRRRDRRDRHRDDAGRRRARSAPVTMTIGRLRHVLDADGARSPMPVIQLASIGTQMTEAFAGLDRIREIRRDGHRRSTKTRSSPPMPDIRGDVEFDDVSFEYSRGDARA